jgi:hypothetical chaperone protein
VTVRIGLDFGTTNSGVSILQKGQARVLAIDPLSRDPAVVRSTLYITREHEAFIGREAIELYYRQNVGRPSRMTRQYVGEIEMTFAELPTFVQDVYVLVDQFTPGRLLRSLKSGLSTTYEGTTILGRFYTLEELVAIYLRQVRQRAEKEIGQRITAVTLGRPVNFVGSKNGSGNQRAVERLRRAAEMAGFEDISFQLEPVAAALHYEQSLTKPQRIVVFDFGGGTLDITVMRVGNPTVRQIYATGGLGIAGDIFDQRIVEHLILAHFGRGSTYGEDKTLFPDLYTDALTSWQTALELNRPERLRFLEVTQLSSSHPARVCALLSLIANNYVTRLFDKVERSKIRLSERIFTTMRLAGEDIQIWQPITRSQFEALIADETHRIEQCLLDTLARSGLETGEIDAVVRTGGSAQIPCFVEMLGRIFGPEKVVLSSAFSSVTAGLALGPSVERSLAP